MHEDRSAVVEFDDTRYGRRLFDQFSIVGAESRARQVVAEEACSELCGIEHRWSARFRARTFIPRFVPGDFFANSSSKSRISGRIRASSRLARDARSLQRMQRRGFDDARCAVTAAAEGEVELPAASLGAALLDSALGVAIGGTVKLLSSASRLACSTASFTSPRRMVSELGATMPTFTPLREMSVITISMSLPRTMR